MTARNHHDLENDVIALLNLTNEEIGGYVGALTLTMVSGHIPKIEVEIARGAFDIERRVYEHWGDRLVRIDRT